jgi:hypothetical protein
MKPAQPSTAASAVLGEYAAHVEAIQGDANAGLQALLRRIDRGDPAMDLDDDAPAPVVAPPRRVRLSVAIALVGLASAAAVAAMWFGGPGLRAVMQESPTVEAVYGVASPSSSATMERGVEATAASVVSARGEASGGSRDASVPVAVEVPVVVESLAQVEVPAHVPVRKPVVRPRVEAVVPDAAVQDDAPSDPLLEVRGLARARAALRDRDAKSALRLLDAHRREHPQSAYDEERDLLVVAALCDAGRSDDARAAAAKFRRAHPGSPLTAHLSGCTNESP